MTIMWLPNVLRECLCGLQSNHRYQKLQQEKEEQKPHYVFNKMTYEEKVPKRESMSDRKGNKGRMAKTEDEPDGKICIADTPKSEGVADKIQPNLVPKTENELSKSAPNTTIPTSEGEKQPLRWEDILTQLSGTCYKPMTYNEEFCAEWAEFMLDDFGLHYRKGTRFIFENGTDSHIGYCEEGVFAFSMDFESARLISDTLEGALVFLTNYGTLGQGKWKDAGEPYFG